MRKLNNGVFAQCGESGDSHPACGFKAGERSPDRLLSKVGGEPE